MWSSLEWGSYWEWCQNSWWVSFDEPFQSCWRTWLQWTVCLCMDVFCCFCFRYPNWSLKVMYWEYSLWNCDAVIFVLIYHIALAVLCGLLIYAAQPASVQKQNKYICSAPPLMLPVWYVLLLYTVVNGSIKIMLKQGLLQKHSLRRDLLMHVKYFSCWRSCPFLAPSQNE